MKARRLETLFYLSFIDPDFFLEVAYQQKLKRALLLSIEPMPLERQVNGKMRMVFMISQLKSNHF